MRARLPQVTSHAEGLRCWIKEFGGFEKGAVRVIPSSNQHFPARKQGRAMPSAHVDHVAAQRSKTTRRRIEKLSAMGRIIGASGNQHPAIEEQRGGVS